MIGPNTNIAGANHDYIQINKLMVNAGSIGLEVVIGHDVWIGAGCNITPGTTIGDGAVIAMGTTVMKYVHPGEIVGSGKQFTIGFREGFVDPCNSSFDKLRSKEASTVQGDKRP